MTSAESSLRPVRLCMSASVWTSDGSSPMWLAPMGGRGVDGSTLTVLLLLLLMMTWCVWTLGDVWRPNLLQGRADPRSSDLACGRRLCLQVTGRLWELCGQLSCCLMTAGL